MKHLLTHRMNKQKGFTLLLAALVAAVVLTIGTAIFTITIKQIALSSIVRDSAFAFYAADTGAECALYWDQTYNYFDIIAPTEPAASDPHCDGKALNAESTRDGAYPQDMNFTIDVGSTPRCVEVTVHKEPDPVNPANIKSTVTSNGYNVPCAQVATNAQVIQRSEEVNY